MSYQLAYSVRVLTVMTNKLTQLLRVHSFLFNKNVYNLAEPEIPPRCNVKASLCTYNLFLVNWYFYCIFEETFPSLLHVVVGLVALSAVISIFSYTRIFFKLRQQQAQVQDGHQGQPNGEGIPLNIARYKKNSLQHSVGAVGIGCLLCSVYYFFCVNNDNLVPEE